MDAPSRIILGSRGSELALAQARLVETALRQAWPKLEVAVEIIRTSGDENSQSIPIVDRKWGRKGMFTREIEKELLVRRIDVAVHSAKDLPSERHEDLEVRATLPRGFIEDLLITKDGGGLTTLPIGATLATGSIRRRYQLLAKRPDLLIAELRGNVPTRLRKLHETEGWSGIVLARAGLERLGLEMHGEILSPEDFVPAGGQGVIALQVRREDKATRRIVEAVNDRASLLALRAEREFLRILDGDCNSPVGVHAVVEGESLHLRAQIFATETEVPKTGNTTGPSHDPEAIARSLMQSLYGG